MIESKTTEEPDQDAEKIIINLRNIVEKIVEFEVKSWNTKFVHDLKIKQASLHVIEVAISQKIANLLLTSNTFKNQVYKSKFKKGTLIYPLKKEWINILERESIFCNRVMCMIVWAIFSAALLFRDIFKKILNLKNLRIKKIPIEAYGSVYFYDVSAENLEGNSDYNLLHWWRSKVGNDFISHSVVALKKSGSKKELTFYVDSPFIKLSLLKSMQIWGRVFKILMVSKQLKFVPHIFSIYEYIKIINYPECVIPKRFVFNSTRGTYVPLSTYGLIQSKFTVDYLFYATHSEPDHLCGKHKEFLLWHMFTWPNVYVIDKVQKFELMASTKNSTSIDEKGVPWWSDSEEILAGEESFVVSWFESFKIAPIHLRSNTFDEYESNKKFMIKKIFLDLIKLSELFEFKIFVKMKRPLHDVDFNELLDYDVNRKLTMVNPGIAPIKLIRISSLVISKPFSTIGVIAKECRVPVVEYWPSNVTINDRFHTLRQIPLLTRFEELKKVLYSLKNYE